MWPKAIRQSEIRSWHGYDWLIHPEQAKLITKVMGFFLWQKWLSYGRVGIKDLVALPIFVYSIIKRLRMTKVKTSLCREGHIGKNFDRWYDLLWMQKKLQ